MYALRKVCVLLTIGLLVLILYACQPQVGVAPPTTTPFPTWTPTPTPGPAKIYVTDLKRDCSQLNFNNREVILEGLVFLPDQTVFGYTIDGIPWLGVNFVGNSSITALLKVGNEPVTMNPLPPLFSTKDLIIHANDGRLILDNHKVRITGRPKYRDDNPERSCEVFVNDIESLENPEAVIPQTITINELLNKDAKNDCKMLEKNKQLVRITGKVSVNKETSCWGGWCTISISDDTGTMKARFSTEGGPNTITTLPVPYRTSDISLFDKEGIPIETPEIVLIGDLTSGVDLTGKIDTCLITVFSILPVEAD